jgi:peroxin-13
VAVLQVRLLCVVSAWLRRSSAELWLCAECPPGSRAWCALSRPVACAAKPWHTDQPGAAASSLGASSAQDGGPRPWEAGATISGGDTPAAAAPEHPWTRPGETVQPLASTSAVGQYNGGQYGAVGAPYGGIGSTVNSYVAPGGSMYGQGAYGATSMYGRPAGPYSSMYGASGGMYGSTGYGAGSMHGTGSGYGGSMYGAGGGYGGGTMYGSGGGMYGGMGSSMYGGAGMGGPYDASGAFGVPGFGGALGMGGAQGPMGPVGTMQPGHQRTRWQIFMETVNGLMNFFGRVSFLVDENAHAVHFFITALLQMLDRASFLWGEIARFVLRIVGYKFAAPGPSMAASASAYALKGGAEAGQGASQQQQQQCAAEAPQRRLLEDGGAQHTGLEAAWPG